MSLYLKLAAASVRARLQYKWDFIITLLLFGLISAGEFITLAVVLYRYPRIAGWNLYEIALLSGVAGTSYGLFRVFGAELVLFERYLTTGEFDSLMIRPWPTLATLLARNFDLTRLGGALQGAILLAVGLRGVLRAGAPGWLVFYASLLPIPGACIIGALALGTAAAGFWITRIDELSVFTTNAPVSAASYPMQIFPGWMQRLLLGVLPVAAMGYVPLNFALGKGGSPLNLAAPFVAAGLSLAAALRLWGWGERRYQSTGS